MKSFSVINGLMLGIVFGSATLAILASDWMDPAGNEGGKPAFAHLVRSETKTFFGKEHYYFTFMFREDRKENRVTQAVGPELYHLRREGDNVEILRFKGGRVRLRGNSRETPAPAGQPILWISLPLTILGILLLLDGARSNRGTNAAPARSRRSTPEEASNPLSAASEETSQ